MLKINNKKEILKMPNNKIHCILGNSKNDS